MTGLAEMVSQVSMKMTTEQMEELVNTVNGTCESIYSTCERLFGHEICEYENEMEICGYVDDRIFECGECGWWYDAGWWNTDESVTRGENICLGCAPETDE